MNSWEKQLRNHKKNNFYVFLCIIAIFAIPLVYLHDEILTWVSGEELHSEVHVSFYYVSNECVTQFYPDMVDENGMIFVSDQTEIPSECEAKLLGQGVLVVFPHQTHQQSVNMTNKTFVKMRSIGANLLYVDEVITKVPTTFDTNGEEEIEYDNKEKFAV